MLGRWTSEPEQAGLSVPLSRQIDLLSDTLADSLEEVGGPEVPALMQALVAACERAGGDGDYGEAQARLRALDGERIDRLLRAGLVWFHLLNAAEKQEIVRVNRARMRAEGGAPAPDSLDCAVAALKEARCSRSDAAAAVARLDIQPTLTAHPTEADRRTVQGKLQRIGGLLDRLQDGALSRTEERAARDALRNEIVLLLLTEPVRRRKPGVEAEVAYGVFYLGGPIWDAAPEIYRAVGHALERHYGAASPVPAFLRFRSWIGGDRDGNPDVTPAVTRKTLELHRRTALDRHLEELAALRDELTISDLLGAASTELQASIAADLARLPPDGRTRERFAHAPYQLKIACMMARLAAERERAGGDGETREAYRAREYVADLERLQRSLAEAGLPTVAKRGRLARAMGVARTFGFHLAALDIRQHSEVHEAAVAALLKAASAAEDYAGLPEEERLAVLDEALSRPQPLLARDASPPDAARDVLEVLRVVRATMQNEPAAIGSYVISMTHEISDVLEVLLLLREAGLWQVDGRRGHAPMDVVPLYETIDDLAEAGERLARLFGHPAYRAQLAGRGNFQEIMIGYSDSNKDGGFWMANCRLHFAQEEIARICHEHAVAFRLFHGRGGTVERGGGLTNQEMLAAAPAFHNGRLRFTEQGEVISFRYGSRDLATRHLEQVAHALLRATGCGDGGRDALAATEAETFQRLGERAMAAYRRLIEDEAFWPWYVQATPVRHIGRLPIASRPVSRGGQELDFAGLRAIPWVFAWSQTRYAAPGWFGLGSALEAGGPDVDALHELYDKSAFFRLVVRNAERELARARPAIARLYAAPDHGQDARIHQAIRHDFEGTRRAVLAITGQNALLDDQPVLRDVIAFRNTFADLLHLFQLELMRRWRAADGDEAAALERTLFLSIDAVAAAMESTG